MIAEAIAARARVQQDTPRHAIDGGAIHTDLSPPHGVRRHASVAKRDVQQSGDGD